MKTVYCNIDIYNEHDESEQMAHIISDKYISFAFFILFSLYCIFFNLFLSVSICTGVFYILHVYQCLTFVYLFMYKDSGDPGWTGPVQYSVRTNKK